MSVLRFESVSKQYPGGHPALVDVSFQVEEGEMLFVTGHSGAGKSTLLLLVADEPTGNLDPTLSAEIMELFAGLPERGTSVLVVSHDLPLLKRMRKRVLILDHGRLVDDISPQDLAE